MKKALLLLSFLPGGLSLVAATITLTMNFQGVQRDFLVHFPPAFSNSENLPLVINMHGYGSNAAQQEFYSRMSETADANRFVVCYPNGIANAWNAGFQVPYNSSPDDVGFVSKIIDTLQGLYNINLARVYACGMSNGGFQSYRLACDLENRIAAIASVTGNITELTALNCALARHIPVLHIHGTEDPLVNYAGSTGYKSVEETIGFFLTANQCSATNDTVAYPNTNTTDSSTVERIHYADCASGTEVMFYKITGGGHTWPNAYIDWIYGPTNRDFDASQEIWDFFNRFTLNGPVGIDAAKASHPTIDLFPNPTDGDLEMRISDFGLEPPTSIYLFDMSGKMLLEQKITAPTSIIYMQDFSAGVYFARIEGKGFSVVKRIVKN